MLPAPTYAEVIRTLERAFPERYPVAGWKGVRMAGLLFARPELTLAKEEIVPHLDHFHYQSADRIDFFCSGYFRYVPEDQAPEDSRRVTDAKPPWSFSLSWFQGFQDEITRLGHLQHPRQAHRGESGS